MAITRDVMIHKATVEGIFQKTDKMLSEYMLCVHYKDRVDKLYCTRVSLVELAVGYLYTEQGVDITCGGYTWTLTEEDAKADFIVEEIPQKETEEVSYKRTEKYVVSLKEIRELMEQFSCQSNIFAQTGNAHSARFVSKDGSRDLFCEDIGRHNALDKVIGTALLEKINLSNGLIFLSGRVPSDMMSKLCKAKITMAVSVSAPTANSVQLAEEKGMTLIGFARSEKMNIYNHGGRIIEFQK